MTTTCFLNPRAPRGAYPEELAAVLSPAQGARYAAWLVGWPRVPVAPTPLVSLRREPSAWVLGGWR